MQRSFSGDEVARICLHQKCRCQRYFDFEKITEKINAKMKVRVIIVNPNDWVLEELII